MAKSKPDRSPANMTAKEKAFEDTIDKLMAEHKLVSRWCLDDVAIDFAKPHRFKGAVKVWMGVKGDKRVYAYIEGTTNLDLWRAADAVIAKSDYPTHRFIEGFKMSGENALQVQAGL